MSQPRLSPELIEIICTALYQGCHVKTACARAGVPQQTMNVWLRRGKAEFEERESDPSNGANYSEQTIYEQFYHAVEQAKGAATFTAETRLFETNPLAWLRMGYARNDWRTSNQGVKEFVEEFVKTLERQGMTQGHNSVHIEPPLQDLPTILQTLLEAGVFTFPGAEPEPHVGRTNRQNMSPDQDFSWSPTRLEMQERSEPV